MLAQSEVIGPDVVLPGSQQLAPVVFGLLAVVLLIVVGIAALLRRRRRADPDRGRPIVLGVLSALSVAALVATFVTLPPSFSTPEFPPIGRLFPDEAVFYRTAVDLPVSPDSDRYLATLRGETFVAGFGGEPIDGVVFGIPFNLVDDSTPRTEVTFRNTSKPSFEGPYPITDPAYIESMPTYGFDQHYVALDRSAATMWELIGTTVWFGRWEADAGARWDLDSLDYGRWGTTVAGLPLLPGVLGYDEVAGGSVDHVVYAGAPAISSGDPVWPALSSDGRSDDPDAPPMGSWLRLRSDVDLSSLGPQARAIAEGLQEYGMLLNDTGGRFGLRGTPDARWDRADLRTLSELAAEDFEVVDQSAVMVAPDSMAARQPGG